MTPPTTLFTLATGHMPTRWLERVDTTLLNAERRMSRVLRHSRLRVAAVVASRDPGLAQWAAGARSSEVRGARAAEIREEMRLTLH